MSDLNRFRYHDMLERYATKFSLDPDYVYKNVTFATMAVYLEKWTREGEKADIYTELERLMHAQ